jgi:hypothetical protein
MIWANAMTLFPMTFPVSSARAVRALAESEPFEQLDGVATGGGRGPAVQTREVHGLLEQPHLRVETALLGHVAEAAAVGLGERSAAEADSAGIRREHAEDDAHRRGLACAVAADEAGEAAVAHREADAVEGEALAVAFGDVVEFEHGFTVRMPRRRGIRRTGGSVAPPCGGGARMSVCSWCLGGFRMSEALVTIAR